MNNAAAFASLPVPAIVVQVQDEERGLSGGALFVARAFHADGTYTDSIPMSRAGAARMVKALAAR